MAYTNTKDGKIEAPSWYRNDDGSVPSTMQKGLTKENWERQNASRRRMEELANKRTEAKEKADAYLASGGTRNDHNYEKILRDGGTTSAQVQKMQRADKKSKYEQNKKDRKAEAAAYQQSRIDMANHRRKMGSSAERKVDQRAHYEHMKKTRGSYGGDEAHRGAVERLMGTGQKFSSLDIEREKGSSSTHNQKGLYKQYGGIDNYNENYSVGSGNFRGDPSLGSVKEADDKQRQHFQNRADYYNSNEYIEKYGQYDWGRKDRERANKKAEVMNQSFADRERRMRESRYGSVYGFN